MMILLMEKMFSSRARKFARAFCVSTSMISNIVDRVR